MGSKVALILGHLFRPEDGVIQGDLVAKIAGAPSVHRVEKIEGSRWHQFVYRSKDPLTPAEIDQARVPGFRPPSHYDYSMWMAVSHHVLILATNLAVVEAFVVRNLRRHDVRLRRTQIRVDEFVRHLIAQPGQYLLTHFHAKVGGFGDALKTVSLWGDNLGYAQFVQDSTQIMFATQCGLRDADDDRELLRFTNEGKFSFFLDEVRLKPIEMLLSYMNRKTFFVD